jgi:phosphoglucosamine mutase
MQERKYFGTDGIRGCVGTHPVTPEFMLHFAWAVGTIMRERYNGSHVTVLLGKDTRVSGYLLESALEAGLLASGVNVKLVGPLPTPAIAYLTQREKAQAGIMISASHNPYSDNGIKLFSANGFKLQDETELLIESYLEKTIQTVSPHDIGKASRVTAAPEYYAQFAISTLKKNFNLNGMKIVLDCANGATYQVAPQIFTQLGANVIALAVQPNGFNINEQCGSTAPAMLQKTVIEQQADLGIAFDGDGDRVIMVDHQGEGVDGDELLFILAQHAYHQKTLQGGVVATQMSNLGLEWAMQALGIDFFRSQVGDRYVLHALQERAWQLGGENSGHIVHLGVATTGDGIISALQVLQALAECGTVLHEAKKGMQKLPQTMINVCMPTPLLDIVNYPAVRSAVNDAQQSLGQKGRVLLRPSGTEPCIRVMVEGEHARYVEQLAQGLANEVTAAIAAMNIAHI